MKTVTPRPLVIRGGPAGSLILLTVLAVLAALLPGVVPGRQPAAAASDNDPFVEAFVAGGADSGAMFRWWWTGAIEEDQVLEELEAIAEAGYRGVEIAHVMDGVSYAVDPDLYGYGSHRWTAAVSAVLARAAELGLQVDLTVGSRWPAGVPGLDPDGPASSKELAVGYQTVLDGGSFDAEVPPAAPRNYAYRTSENGVISSETRTSQLQYVGTQAIRCVVDDCPGPRPVLDLDTVVDLTADGEDGSVTFDPADGDWVVVGYWYRGTAQRNDAPFGNLPHLLTDPEVRVVDHYSQAGSTAFLDYFDGLLSDEDISLLAEVGASIFEDSLELVANQQWTPEFLTEFHARRGYDLLPLLASTARGTASSPFASPPLVFGFDGDGAETAARVRRDVEQTLHELYMDNHVEPFMRWANDRGIDYRAQGYGAPIDMAEAAATFDIAECESLGCGTTDDWRLVSSGVDLAGKNLVTNEMIPGGFGGNYQLHPEAIIRQANDEFAVGANLLIFHGLPYAHWPDHADGTVVDDSSLWPGFHGFSSNIGQPMGPRNPTWTMEEDVAAHLSRTQLVLQAGTRRSDVAVFNQSLDHIEDAVDGDVLLDEGFSYGYLTPGTLSRPEIVVTDGVLAADGPAYKALVLDQQATIPVDSATTLVQLAQDGLPVFVVGGLPDATPGLDADGTADAEVQQLMVDLLDAGAVQLASADLLPAALEDAGVTASLETANTELRAVRRSTDVAELYWVHNPTGADADVTVSVESPDADLVPYTLDTWTGTVTPLGLYETTPGRVTVRRTITAGAAEVIALAPLGWNGLDAPATPAVDTQADDIVVRAGDLMLRTTTNGVFETELADGGMVTTAVSDVPAPVTLNSWDLTVTEYLPGEPGDPSDVTQYQAHTFTNVPLVPWQDIPGLELASGVGTYSTQISLPGRWVGVDATLDMTRIEGQYRVWVNGVRAPTPDQLGETAVLTGLLRAGQNEIEVEVATNLLNRVQDHRADINASPVDYGMIGAVQLRVAAVTPLFPTAPGGSNGGPGGQPSEEPTDEPTEQPTSEPVETDVQVLAGASRVETAVAISRASFPTDGSADAVVLARADVPFDALACGPVSRLAVVMIL